MAKRKTKSKSSGQRTVVVRERASAPVIIRAPRAAPVKHHKRRRGVSHHGGGKFGSATGAMTPTKSGSLALGGFIYGFIEKNFPQIPTLPVIGKSGAIAIIAYFAGGKNAGIIADVGNAASVIAGYSFGSTGKVSGNLASQVSGVAAQV
ncbi:MAG TPA: hypothetical protein VNO55_31620 [Polyangia bacterium]|nr:hypothetical protein [Polyangia bacterium]